MLSSQGMDAEQAVLGAVLLDSRVWPEVETSVQATDFHLPLHREIFMAISGLFLDNQAVDVVTLWDVLRRKGHSQETLQYVNSMCQNTPSAANVLSYAKTVGNNRLRRDVEQLGQAFITHAEQSKDTTELLEYVTREAMALVASSPEQHEVRSIGAVLPSLMDVLDQRLEAGGILGVATGYSELDESLSGLQCGDLVILAGRPSMGKTTLAVNIAENVTSDLEKVAFVVSLEMTAMQLTERSVSRYAEVNTNALRTGKLSHSDFTNMAVALKTLQDHKLIIADDPALASPNRLRLEARKVKQAHGRLDLIVIDYLQLMSGAGNTRNDELGAITRLLKLLAKELDCPIVLLSQLSRKVEERSDKRPVLSDLRESGAIEQDADVVMMVYRDEYYNPDSLWRGYAEVLIRKQRMGPLGVAHLGFEGHYSRFVPVSATEVARLKADMGSTSNRSQGFSR